MQYLSSIDIHFTSYHLGSPIIYNMKVFTLTLIVGSILVGYFQLSSAAPATSDDDADITYEHPCFYTRKPLHLMLCYALIRLFDKNSKSIIHGSQWRMLISGRRSTSMFQGQNDDLGKARPLGTGFDATKHFKTSTMHKALIWMLSWDDRLLPTPHALELHISSAKTLPMSLQIKIYAH